MTRFDFLTDPSQVARGWRYVLFARTFRFSFSCDRHRFSHTLSRIMSLRMALPRREIVAMLERL